MTADALMKRVFEYSTSLNNCCAYVKDCVYTGKCLVDEDIVGCSQRNDFKKVKEALELQESLIHCKDCKHWNEYYRECNSPNWDTGTDDCFVVPAGFYCGWAERKGK